MRGGARLWTIAGWLVSAAAGCADPDDVVRLRFTADPPLGGDVNVCFAFDAATLGGRPIREVDIETIPGPVVLHHVALYATPDATYPDGPTECTVMPEDATELHVSIPGEPPLRLPDGIGLPLPDGTARIVVQAHALRGEAGPAEAAAIALRLGTDDVLPAAWLPVRAPVPAIRPHTEETSRARCTLGAELHLVSTWPHMHLLGERFEGGIIRVGGEREILVDVDPWAYDDQRAYPVDARLAAGDAIETVCTWLNAGNDYVLPGPNVTDEMCVQSLVVWPAAAAHCVSP